MKMIMTISSCLLMAALCVGCGKGKREVPAPPETTCAENITAIVQANQQWAYDATLQRGAETRDPDLASLVAVQMVPAHMARCPHASDAQREFDYVYLYADPTLPDAVRDSVVVACLGCGDSSRGYIVGRLDGMVETLTPDAFNAELARWPNADFKAAFEAAEAQAHAASSAE